MKTVVLDLICELDNEELLDRAQQLSSQLSRLKEVEVEKVNSAKAFKDQLDAIAGAISRLSFTIRRRAESRPVNCQVIFYSPAVGTKRTVRTDTGEFVKDEPMSSTECQNNLFEKASDAEQVDLPELVERIEEAGATGLVAGVLDGLAASLAATKP